MHMAQHNQASIQQQKQQQFQQQQQQQQQQHQHQLAQQLAQQQHQQQLPPTQSLPPQLSPWNEEQTIDALRRLDELRSQITQLRSTIPDMIAPFLRVEQMATPQELYDAFEKQVKHSTASVAAFKENFIASQDLFKRATTLRAANPKGVVRVPRKDCIDFRSLKQSDSATEKAEKDAAEKKKTEHDGEKEFGTDVDEGEPDLKSPEESLMQFKQEHPEIEVVENVLLNEYKFTLPPPAHLSITVKLPSPGQTSPPQILSVTPAKWRPNDKIPPVHTSLERALKARPHKASFSSLLQQIVTYKWLYDTECYICNKLTAPRSADMPVLRKGDFTGKRKRGVEDAEDDNKANGVNGDSRKIAKLMDGWCAVHEACLAEVKRKDSTGREQS